MAAFFKLLIVLIAVALIAGAGLFAYGMLGGFEQHVRTWCAAVSGSWTRRSATTRVR